jgi:serine/threonine protein kinase
MHFSSWVGVRATKALRVPAPVSSNPVAFFVKGVIIYPGNTFLDGYPGRCPTNMDSVIAKRIETELLGREVSGWKIVARINSGKSAVVFKAVRDTETAALKVFDPEMVERYGKSVQLARIDRELTLRGKHHPNLVRIFDGGECPRTGYLFVAMELVEGPVLASILASIPREKMWPLISQVASAARFLETLNLVHRDIKPENIAISPDFQRAVLLDLGVLRPFGVAGLTDEEQRAFVGTLQYSPPEFLVREEEDSPRGWRAVTFYQLGAVLHDVIMRRQIFADQCSPYGLLVRAVERVNPRIDASDAPPDLIVLANSCLQKDPMLRLDLVKWEDFEPPQLRADPKTDDPISRVRRRRAIAERSKPQGAEIDVEQRARSARRTLDRIQATLQNDIHQECIGSELFPPVEIHDAQPPNANAGRFRVHLCASAQHALPQTLSIFLAVELLDQSSEAIRISYSAAISQAPLDWDLADSAHFQEFFKGVYNQSAVNQRLKTMLYALLDQAQAQSPQAEPKSILWLTGPQSGDTQAQQ